MRERVQLIRVSHPHLGPYEADLIATANGEEQGHVVYLPFSPEDSPLRLGERIVMSWYGESSKRGRGIVEEIRPEDIETHESEWQTLKLSVSMQDLGLNLRHYPRLIGGFEFFYASFEEIETPEEWLLSTTQQDEVRSDARFKQPTDELINFSVSGLSFESNHPIDISSSLACAIAIGGSSDLIRCLGKVVRCVKADRVYQIALHFISPPQDLIDELSEFTLKIQREETGGGVDEV